MRVLSSSSASSLDYPGRKGDDLHTKPIPVEQPCARKSVVLHGSHVLPLPKKIRNTKPTFGKLSPSEADTLCYTMAVSFDYSITRLYLRSIKNSGVVFLQRKQPVP